MGGELRPPLTKRLRPGHWTALDCVPAIGLAVLYGTTHSKGFHPAFGLPVWLCRLVAFPTPVSIALRRRWPMPALAVAVIGSTVLIVCGLIVDPVLVPVASTLYMVAVSLPRLRAVLALAATFVVLGSAALVAGSLEGVERTGLLAGHLFSALWVCSAAWTIGFAVRQRRAYTAGLQEQAERRAAERLGAERLRIARELHDVVAHSMSLIAVQAGVAGYVAAERPQEAVRALGSIEATSRSALREMRRLLGVLRADGAAADLEPAPGLADLPRLADRTAQAGVRVDLRVVGPPRDLPAGADLAAYRIAQEALTNVVKHASVSTCRVSVTYAPTTVTLEIIDTGRGAAAGESTGEGHGIAGMRERVTLYGGSFEAGPLPARGFRVSATLPTEPPDPAMGVDPVWGAGAAVLDGRVAGAASPAASEEVSDGTRRKDAR